MSLVPLYEELSPPLITQTHNLQHLLKCYLTFSTREIIIIMCAQNISIKLYFVWKPAWSECGVINERKYATIDKTQLVSRSVTVSEVWLITKRMRNFLEKVWIDWSSINLQYLFLPLLTTTYAPLPLAGPDSLVCIFSCFFPETLTSESSSFGCWLEWCPIASLQ